MPQRGRVYRFNPIGDVAGLIRVADRMSPPGQLKVISEKESNDQ